MRRAVLLLPAGLLVQCQSAAYLDRVLCRMGSYQGRIASSAQCSDLHVVMLYCHEI